MSNKDLTFEELIDAFHQIEKFDEHVVKIDMTPSDFSSIRKHQNFVHTFDAVTQSDILRTGFFGSLYGAQIYLDKDNKNTFLTSNHNRIYKIGEDKIKKKDEKKSLKNSKLKFIWRNNE
jgi:hypothetical protein